jgi:hypothetical protein
MIVKIFPPTKNSASFPAVSYNTGKIDKTKGELMKVSGFGPLHALEHWRPEDFRNYLKAVSATNKAVKFPQFHAVISAEGRSHDKYQLTEIATQWLTAMGYGDQPYLLVFHNDTRNNHIHIVTTRVNKQGKKIDHNFENVRGIKHLNKILGLDEKHNSKQDIAKALSYHFSTKAQFMMILENQGYVLKETEGKFEVIKFGQKQAEIDLGQLTAKMEGSKASSERTAQIKAIFHKYAAINDTSLLPNTVPLPGNYRKIANGYTSEFAAYLKEKHGMVLIFHAKDGKPPYGYSVIDHSGKAVYKGGEIMPLQELLNSKQKTGVRSEEKDTNNIPPSVGDLDKEARAYYKAILEAAMRNYPDLMQGLHHLGLNIRETGGRLYLDDQSSFTSVPIDELLNEPAFAALQRQYFQAAETMAEVHLQHVPVPSPVIANDVDDEAVYGRKRRRKQQQ